MEWELIRNADIQSIPNVFPKCLEHNRPLSTTATHLQGYHRRFPLSRQQRSGRHNPQPSRVDPTREGRFARFAEGVVQYPPQSICDTDPSTDVLCEDFRILELGQRFCLDSCASWKEAAGTSGSCCWHLQDGPTSNPDEAQVGRKSSEQAREASRREGLAQRLAPARIL